MTRAVLEHQPLRLEATTARLLRWMQRRGRPQLVQTFTEPDIQGHAFDLAHIFGTRLWMIRTRSAGRRRIQAAWLRALSRGAGELRSGLSGTMHPDDRVELIPDARTVLAAHAELYGSATRTIDVATYYLQADEAGWNVARLLAESARRGVRVRFIADRQATERKLFGVAGMNDLFAFLAAAGAEVRFWEDPARPYDRTHRKLVVVDGRSALFGSRNFADHYQSGAWRDIDILLDGPSVAPLGQVFEETWDGRAGSAPADTRPWFRHAPARVTQDPTVCFALGCAEAAERTIDVELAYFTGTSVFCQSLVRAARRGVRVRLLTNSVESTDLPSKSYSSCLGIRDLLRAGATVRLRRGKGRTLHCKYLVADGEWVSVGSHNLDHFSSRLCCEANLQVRSAALARTFTAFFDTGLAETTPAEPASDVDEFLAQARPFALLDRVIGDLT